MNKCCTNSFCRRTFSTLNSEGKCPFCGKNYPQLNCGRKHDLSEKEHEDWMKLRIRKGGRYDHLNIRLGELNQLASDSKTDEMIRVFREQIGKRGYYISLKAGTEFCRNLTEKKDPPTEWRLTGEEKEGRRIIEPVDRVRVSKRQKRRAFELVLSDEDREWFESL